MNRRSFLGCSASATAISNVRIIPRMKMLLVLGASGEMGRRIIRLARRLLPGVRVVEASRHPNPGNPDQRRVDIHDHDCLSRALRDVDALVNAVGPFNYDPTPLV